MLFTIKLHHRGKIIGDKYKSYVGGETSYIDIVDGDEFSLHELDRMITKLGYPENLVIMYHYLDPTSDLNHGLRDFQTDAHVVEFLKWVTEYKVMDIYCNHMSQEEIVAMGKTAHVEVKKPEGKCAAGTVARDSKVHRRK